MMIDDFANTTRALVVPHFNVHTYCDRLWCWARDLNDLENDAEDKVATIICSNDEDEMKT